MPEGLFAITRILTAVITGVLGPFFIWWIKERNSEEEESETKGAIDKEVKFAQDISEKLRDILRELNADRVWISQFHNGGKMLNVPRKASVKRISTTHEVTATGVSREQHRFNDILITFFSELIDKLIKEDHVAFDENQKEIAPEIELLFRQRGTAKMYLFAMKNIDDSLIGMMGIDYTRKMADLNEQELQYLKLKANLLAGYVIHGKVENE